jgi:predicted Zn finger-like uncharacterized protein
MYMFTQCPQCETVFRLTADALSAAGGQVRCGRCSEVFDALKRLTEEPRMFVIGESTLELEARAEQILRGADELPGDGADPARPMELAEEDGIARLEVQDIDLGDVLDVPLGEFPPPAQKADSTLEFTLPPDELDRIFVGAREEAVQPPDIAAAVAADLSTEGGTEQDSAAPATEPAAIAADEPQATRGERMAWTLAAALLGLVLVAQVVHRYREPLAANPAVGGWLRAVYAAVGNPIPAPASLNGYQLRQWGASGDATASGALRVRASIQNTSGQMQPFPLLRVTLADRFGSHLGSKDFEPTDYLGRPVTRLLAPGERADATVDIQDPGKSAEGFELDVCLRNADGRVRCAGDNAPRP